MASLWSKEPYLMLESVRKWPCDSIRTTFRDLSDDVVFIIAAFVGIDPELGPHRLRDPGFVYGHTDLLHLSLCSSRLYKIVEPVLYSRFCHIQSYNALKDNRLLSFMCRILSRPELANHVRRIEDYARRVDDPFEMIGLSSEDWARVNAATRAASQSVEEAQAWTKEIQKGAWDPIIALILSLTPNLCELKFGAWNWLNDVYPTTMRLLRRAATLQNRSETSPLSFSKLAKVSLDYWDTRYGMKLETLLPFVELNSIKSFRAFMVSEEHPPSSSDSYPKWISSSLFLTRELTLESCSIHHAYLPGFLRCFQMLERLTYLNGQAGHAKFDPPRLMEALEHLKPCLQELKLVNLNDHVIEPLDAYPIGSFHGFRQLRSIDLRATMLIGKKLPTQNHLAEEFPANQALAPSVPHVLESLTLRECDRDCDERLVAEISHLLTHKQTYAPGLKWLNLEWEKIRYPDKPSPNEPFEHNGFTKDDVLKLLAECKLHGVEMFMKTMAPKPKYVFYMKEQAGINAMPLQCTNVFHYPYEGYEECCTKHGCDPKTGHAPAV